MKPPTAAQENSLKKLIHGKLHDREQAIAAQPAKVQNDLRTFINRTRSYDLLIELLLSDLTQAGKSVKDSPKDQFLRRSTVRMFAAAVEGILFSLKQRAIAAAEFSNFTLTDDEVFLLKEQKPLANTGKKLKFPGFRDNFKLSFNTFSRVYRATCTTDFGSAGFESLCKTFELRNRLMHPKSIKTYCVTDEEKQTCADASAWLHRELDRLMDACQSGVANLTW